MRGEDKFYLHTGAFMAAISTYPPKCLGFARGLLHFYQQ